MQTYIETTSKFIDGNKTELTVYDSAERCGCDCCYFKNLCINPPVDRVMPCFSIDRLDGKSVYYKTIN